MPRVLVRTETVPLVMAELSSTPLAPPKARASGAGGNGGISVATEGQVGAIDDGDDGLAEEGGAQDIRGQRAARGHIRVVRRTGHHRHEPIAKGAIGR